MTGIRLQKFNCRSAGVAVLALWDLTPGNYLAKVRLPMFCVLVAVAVANKGKQSSTAAVISLITISVLFSLASA